MPILNTRDVRATRFESSASNDTFRVLSVLVVALRAYSLHKCILMTNPLPRDLKNSQQMIVNAKLKNAQNRHRPIGLFLP